MHQKKAIIIGSGVAGMAAATRLAILGYDVTVYEKNSGPGGKLTAFEKDNYRFDAGPSLFTQPENITELFTLAKEPIEKYFTYKPVNIACKYFFENGKVINAYTDANLFAKELQINLGEDPEKVISYLKNAQKIYENIGILFLNNSLHKAKTWLNKGLGKALQTLKPGYLFKSLNKHNYQQFKAAETVQIFNRFATYNGSNPYKAPSMLSVIPHLEQNQGTYYPIGGMISITNALHQLALTKGVTFNFNAPVKKIIEDKGEVKGVIVGEEKIYADTIISNGDVYFTYKNLLNSNRKAVKILQQERSSSAVIFYWGISKQFTKLQLHNIFFSNNYQQEFDAIFNTKQCYHDPTIYINITSKEEASQAPDGKENWFVMVNVAANTGQNWEDRKAFIKQAVLSKLNRLLEENIEALIDTEETLDPLMIEEQTASFMGSLYGTSSNSKLAAFFRHANFTSSIKGLYFCGGSVHPGGGIPLCLKSAKIVSEIIEANDKKNNY